LTAGTLAETPVAVGDSFLISNLTSELTEELTSTLSNGSVAQKNISYATKYGESILDENGRYYDDSRLIRLQVQDDSPAEFTNAVTSVESKISKSKLEHWQPYIYSNEMRPSFSKEIHTNLSLTMASGTLADGTVLTLATTVADDDYVGKYIAVESAFGHGQEDIANKARGGHTFHQKWLSGTDTGYYTGPNIRGGNGYEIMYVEAKASSSSYTVKRGTDMAAYKYNTRKRGWLVDAKIFQMDDTSYHVRNISSAENTKSLLLFSNSSGKINKAGSGVYLNDGSTNWRDCSLNNNLQNRLIFGGSGQYDTTNAARTSSGDGGPKLTTVGIGSLVQEPENFLLLAKDKQFDRIHIRMKNSLTTHSTTTVKPTASSGSSQQN
jgi:hypothetical protein